MGTYPVNFASCSAPGAFKLPKDIGISTASAAR